MALRNGDRSMPFSIGEAAQPAGCLTAIDDVTSSGIAAGIAALTGSDDAVYASGTAEGHFALYKVVWPICTSTLRVCEWEAAAAAVTADDRRRRQHMQQHPKLSNAAGCVTYCTSPTYCTSRLCRSLDFGSGSSMGGNGFGSCRWLCTPPSRSGDMPISSSQRASVARSCFASRIRTPCTLKPRTSMGWPSTDAVAIVPSRAARGRQTMHPVYDLCRFRTVTLSNFWKRAHANSCSL